MRASSSPPLGIPLRGLTLSAVLILMAAPSWPASATAQAPLQSSEQQAPQHQAPPAENPAPLDSPPAAHPPTNSPPNPSALEALPPPALEEALSWLKSHFVRQDSLTPEALNRALLRGLLLDLAPGVRLLQPSEPAPPELPFLSGNVTKTIACIRLPATTPETSGCLTTALSELSQQNITGLILDLRAATTGTFESAAAIASHFVKDGTPLFQIRHTGKDPQTLTALQAAPRWGRPLIVLIGPRTSGPPEALAAALRAHAGAILLGQRTAGLPVQFSRLPLGPAAVIECATAEAHLPAEPGLFPRGAQPDIPIPVPPETETSLMAQATETGFAALITEPRRPRFNEAALVQDTNPELDSPAENQPQPLIDTALQRAADILTALALLKK